MNAAWTVMHNSYGDPFWTLSANGMTAQVWEVASRPGRFQWSAHTDKEFYPVGGGDEYGYESLGDAKADAERALEVVPS